MIRLIPFQAMRLLIAVIFVSNYGITQGPVDGFFKGKGNLDVALSAAYQHSDEFYFGTTLANYERNLNSFSVFGEYGILENLDVIANIPLINGQLQDAGFYFKYRLFRKKLGDGFPLAIIPAVGMSFPLSNYATQTSQAVGQRATQFQPKLVLQLNLNHGFFIQSQGGYNYALDPVQSSIPVSGKIGFSKNKLYTDAWFDYQKGLGDVMYGGSSIDFRTLSVTYSKIGGVIYYGFKPKWGLFVNGSYIFTGVNIGKAYTIGGGFVYKFDLIK